MSMRDWLRKALTDDDRPPRAERREVPGLGAMHWTGPSGGKDEVKNISSSGIYVKTEERWPQGAVNPIKLTCEDLPGDNPEREVEVRAKAVRWGEDGMGLEFVLPENMELWLFRGHTLAEAAEVVHEFRVARSLSFLKRICPSAKQELDLLFREGLSNVRIRNCIEIALLAEELVANEPRPSKVRAPKSAVLRVAENGSWSDAEITQRFWAGLLAFACKGGENDESVLEYLETLSQMATMHSLLFAGACTRATKHVDEEGKVAASTMVLTANQLMEIGEAHDLLRIDRNLTQLSDLGLLQERVKSKYFTQNDDANVTPTPLGLEMYARCHAHVGPVQEFYHLSAADAPLPAEGA